METPAARAIWAEAVGLADVPALALASLRKGTVVRYDERRASPRAAALLRLLSRAEPAGLSLDGEDAKGRPLFLALREDLDLCLDAFCDRACPEAPAGLRRTIKCFLAVELLGRFGFLAMASKAAAALGARENVFYLERHPANRVLLDWFDRPDARLRQSLSPRAVLRAAARPFALLAEACLPHGPGRTSLEEPRPSVWIEYYPPDIGGYASRAFWAPHMKREGVDLVFYLDRNDTPLEPATAERIERAGFSWVECRRPTRWARLGVGEALSFLGRLLRPGLGPWWFRFFLVERDLLIRLWTLVFDRFRVKVLIQHQETSWKQEVQARAVEAAGGVMVGFNWSHFLFRREPTHMTPQHVYFTWGSAAAEWMEARGTDVRCMLPCGAWVGVGAAPLPLAGKLDPSVTFKLAVFDSNAGYDIYLTEAKLARFVDWLLGTLEAEPSWGAILKPKSPDAYASLPGGARLMERLEALRRARRLVIADFELSPLAVARAADLSVCFSVNSAGMVAGADGLRVVHWDCNGFRDQPFYATPGQKVLYASLEDMGRDLRAAASGDASVGDFSRWRRWVNRFEDERGAERVGGFFEDFLGALASGKPRDEALDGAAATYRRRHGLTG